HRAARDVFHHDVARILADAGVEDLCDVGMVELARERRLGEEELAEHAPAHGVAQRLGENALDRDLAPPERVLAQEHFRGGAFAELANDRIVGDVLHWRGYLGSRLRARAMAARTCGGAVPPTWLRAATEPSGVSTRLASAPIWFEKVLNFESGRLARSTPRRSASRTARATISWASRNGTPLRTR